jgi:4-hydroxybenzoate polyprenyltransferase
MNEIMDVKIDRLSHALAEKPLVRGTLNERDAIVAALVFLVVSFVLTLIFFHSKGAIVLFVLSNLFNTSYNLLGKKIPVMDFALAFSVFLSVLFGAAAFEPDRFYEPVYVAGLLFSMQLLLQNTVAGLKDLKQDIQAGAFTFPMLLGCSVSDEKIYVSLKFRVWAYSVKIIHGAAAIFFAAKHGYGIGVTGIVIVFALILISSREMYYLVFRTPSHRLDFFKHLGKNEVSSLLMILIVFFPFIKINGLLFFIFFPALWAVLAKKFIHGGKFPAI